MKKIVCIALAACFVVALVSFSSSAANISVNQPVNNISMYLMRFSSGAWSYERFSVSDGVYSFTTPPTAQTGFYYNGLEIACLDSFDVISPSGKSVYFGVNIDLSVLHDGSVASAKTLESVIWGSCVVRVYHSGITSLFTPVSFILRDKSSGQIIEVTEEFLDYWQNFGTSIQSFQITAIFDFSSLIGKSVTQFFLFFPGDWNESDYCIYTSPNALLYSFDDVSISYNLIYKPFDDVVQDDLTDIKGQLGTLNSTMNTIDQDVNRVNQSVTDLKDTIEDFQDDLTSSDSSISSDISDKEDIINSIQDAMQNDNALLEDNLNDMITGFPGAQDPFHDAPSPDGFFAVQFIQQLWSFIKAQTVFFDFIFLGLCFCLATFILRR